MNTYFYTREIVNDQWNINNPNRRDESGNQIFLSSEIENLFPTYMFKLYCNNEDVCICFDNKLTINEKNLLDTCISNHKNNI
jgi:hypothetical protein